MISQVEDETQVSRATQAEQDHYEMHVRAANIVRNLSRSAENCSLMPRFATCINMSIFCIGCKLYIRFQIKVRAGESLMKLVSDLKQFLILNDFPSVNEAISLRNQQLRALQEECDKKLISLRDEIAVDLYELEEEYYSSRYK